MMGILLRLFLQNFPFFLLKYICFKTAAEGGGIKKQTLLKHAVCQTID